MKISDYTASIEGRADPGCEHESGLLPLSTGNLTLFVLLGAVGVKGGGSSRPVE